MLFRLETTDLELQLDTVSAALSVAEAAYAAGSVQQEGSVPLAASQLELARKALEDLTALYETGAATKTQLDEAKLKLEGPSCNTTPPWRQTPTRWRRLSSSRPRPPTMPQLLSLAMPPCMPRFQAR